MSRAFYMAPCVSFYAGARTRAGAQKPQHAVNFPLAPGYQENGRNGAPPPASSRTRREPAPRLAGLQPPFSAQLITRPSRARSRTRSDLPPARSRGAHDAGQNPLRPHKRIEGDFCALLHHNWAPRIAPTTAVLDLGDNRFCRSRSVPPNVAQARKRQILDKEFVLQGVRAHRRIGHRDVCLRCAAGGNKNTKGQGGTDKRLRYRLSLIHI